MGAYQNSSQEIGLSFLGTGIGTIAKTQNGATKTTSEIDDKNWIKE
jgi:hypothetical protein